MSYRQTFWEALRPGPAWFPAIAVSVAYVVLFAFAIDVIDHTVAASPAGGEPRRFALELNPAGSLPYVEYRPAASWLVDIDLIQAVELFLVGSLAFLNGVLSFRLWGLRGSQARRMSFWGVSVVPFFVSNGACAACAGIPAGMAFLPASVAGGVVGIVQFYGLSALIAIVLLTVVALILLDKIREQANVRNGAQA